MTVAPGNLGLRPSCGLHGKWRASGAVLPLCWCHKPAGYYFFQIVAFIFPSRLDCCWQRRKLDVKRYPRDKERSFDCWFNAAYLWNVAWIHQRYRVWLQTQPRIGLGPPLSSPRLQFRTEVNFGNFLTVNLFFFLFIKRCMYYPLGIKTL